MQQPVRVLNAQNIDEITGEFYADVASIGESISGKLGVELLAALKRNRLSTGPYPHVTLFEAANRIMSDLVILHGVRRFLAERTFPFDSYKVEFGNENRNSFDIEASNNRAVLVGEAFNVAPSLFDQKRRASLKKMREGAPNAAYRVLVFNSDAVPPSYSARVDPGFVEIVVDIPFNLTASL